MAGYSFRSYEERQTIQRLWEAGATAKKIVDTLGPLFPPSIRS